MRSILYRKFIHINDQILFTVVKRKSNHPRRTKNEHKNLVVVDNIYIYIYKYLQGCVFNSNKNTFGHKMLYTMEY